MNCNKLTSVVIPNSVGFIGNSAFFGCTGLTEITIPNSVISIGYTAFSGCIGLREIVIPNSVEIIAGGAFANCTGLKQITNLATTPQIVVRDILDVFSGVTASSVKLYVPAQSLDAYKSAAVWKEFDIEAIDNGGTPIKNTMKKNIYLISFAEIRNGDINLNLKAGNYTVEIYNLQGRLVGSVNINAINGINATGLKTNNLSKGMFILNVKQNGAVMLKQKLKI